MCSSAPFKQLSLLAGSTDEPRSWYIVRIWKRGEEQYLYRRHKRQLYPYGYHADEINDVPLVHEDEPAPYYPQYTHSGIQFHHLSLHHEFLLRALITKRYDPSTGYVWMLP